ncbi:unnamed protein product [Adineta steineri]|uniref:Uncharacterized protein n=1 Tax=Adineta steineri TaxID=433720 RepID=A0A813S4N3_9BILA|nr:unnamed protein product [Adineta steineri]CAF3629409.1 unnamed protein product [Adineta steineri]
MSTQSIIGSNLATPIDPDPESARQPSTRPSSWKGFLESRCCKYIKITLLVIYCLNVVAWGGMLFLIFVGGADKTMPDDDTRKVWIEIDSQILNALFCIPGLGLIPWRLRDLYQVYRKKDQHKILHRHSYTTSLLWIRIIVWIFIANSLFQIGMATCMWSMNRFTRPGWLVGIFVGLGCLSGIVAGLIQFILGRKQKKAEKEQQERADILKS